jgi:hypothetical protein
MGPEGIEIGSGETLIHDVDSWIQQQHIQATSRGCRAIVARVGVMKTRPRDLVISQLYWPAPALMNWRRKIRLTAIAIFDVLLIYQTKD